MIKLLKEKLSLERTVSIVLAGTIAGIVTLISSVSFAALMFSGKLTPFISMGITILIATAVVAGSLYSLLSACRPVVAMPDDDTAPILALMVTMVIAGFPADTSAEVLFLSAYGALAATVVFTGLILSLLGFFRLGSLVRYLPYSVMGGYFAGAGLLLIQGAFRVVTDLPLVTIGDFVLLTEEGMFWKWFPAVLSAIFIRWAIKNWFETIAMPAAMFLSIAAFFLFNSIVGMSPDDVMEAGLLVGPFPDTKPSVWNPVLLEHAYDIEWGLIVQHVTSMSTVTLLSAVSLMLTVSGLSVLQRDNIDINRELAVSGFANTVSGLSGGLIALPSMTLTELSMKVGAPRSRMVGLVVALFCGLMLFYGMSAIAWFPKSILAGLLIYLGWSLVERWLLEARKQLPRLEYAVVVAIVLVVATVGFLEGVLTGLLAAIVLFVVNYSRINVVRYALTGAERRSNVERNSAEEGFLKENGPRTLILKLQGYLFFGTAAALAARIEERLEDENLPPLAYAALDFAQVTDMDSSAALSFMKLAQEATKSNFFLLLTGLKPEMQEQLMGNWFEQETTSYVQVMPDLDRGIEWCEERLLREQSLADEHEGIMRQLARYLPTPDDQHILTRYMERREVEPGDELATQGDPSDEMFLLQSCTASVYLDTGSGKQHRIRRAGSGTVFGEVGFYLHTPRTASVVVDTGGELYVLSQEANTRLEQDHPHVAAAMHKFMIRVITRRLQLTTTTLQAVLT